MTLDSATLDRTLRNACDRLLAARGGDGHWEGELSSSPLSTATAVLALALVDEARGQSLTEGQHCASIQRGLQWLVDVQNSDGGWGDTCLSLSNISTTALVWATLAALDACGQGRQSRSSAEAWLARAAGSLAPERLAQAIGDRYGKDRTFSVPILTVLALTGCLGDQRQAWRLVPQLPFELAACPHAWFKWLRLPVVSYALPALIALGRLRHARRPTRNPLFRLTRALSLPRVMRLLGEIQPQGGGFLEATPLTSFVVMSLAASGADDHAVVDRGVEFLLRSQRADGSWPIDTNLATWVTTLAVNALATTQELDIWLPPAERESILDWLLRQQYLEEHPFTHAAPGGWAWTDLSGGVPDADDTPGALLALRHLVDGDARARDAAARGAGWLLGLQNGDGGIPTFCRGWGALPFDRSSADLTAHTVLALCAWLPELPQQARVRGTKALDRMRAYLVKTQRPEGSWSPLWFGNQYSSAEENLTYGTSRVLRAANGESAGANEPAWRNALVAGCRWLLAAQNEDGGWGGDARAPSSIEETALSVEALAALPHDENAEPVSAALNRGVLWLIEATNAGCQFPPAPIGFYFAKLWYFETLYPLIFTVAALGRFRSRLACTADRAAVASLPKAVRLEGSDRGVSANSSPP